MATTQNGDGEGQFVLVSGDDANGDGEVMVLKDSGNDAEGRFVHISGDGDDNDGFDKGSLCP